MASEGAKTGDGGSRLTSDLLARLIRSDANPAELLERLENTSASIWVLWMHLMVVPDARPELRALLCHIWDGMTSDTQLAKKLGVHRHTVRKWRSELREYLDKLPYAQPR